VERKNVEVDPNIWMLTTEEMKNLSARSSILSFFINRTNIGRTSDDNQPINEDNQPINRVNQPINEQSKVKESKVKESKVKENKVVAAATAAVEHYCQNIEPLPSPFVVEKLIDWSNTLNDEVVICAIDEAVMSNVRNMNYVESILKRCLKQNVKTKNDFLANKEQRKMQKSVDMIVKQNQFNSYEQRDYKEEEYERIIAAKNRKT
jgi:DnaD/phage-associated family protein